MLRSTILAILASSLVACGSSVPAPKAPVTEPVAEAPSEASTGETSVRAEDTSASASIPTTCEGGADGCVMAFAAAKKVCAGGRPEVALALFARGTPWRRAYVAVRQADAFSGLGGPTSDEKLIFDEELLVLRERKPDLGGMSVSGVGPSYDMVRWDGTCATLSAGEVTFRKPPKARHAVIPWRNLDDNAKAALMKDGAVSKLATERRKECKGATMGEVSAKCEKADRGLNDAVVEAVRGGVLVAELP